MAVTLGTGCQRLELEQPPTAGSDDGTEPPSAESDDGGDDERPETFDCNPVVQDCNAGEKCTPVVRDGRQDHYACTADDGSQALFDRCVPDPVAGQDACLPGLVCLDATEEGEGSGLCLELCLADGDCPLGRCLDDPRTGVQYCARECDPLETGCSTPLQCRRQDDGFVCRFPSDDDTGEAGAQCLGDDYGCAEGFACLEGVLFPGCITAGCCSPLCDRTAAESTRSCEEAFGAGVQCAPLLDSPRPDLEHVGACYAPA